MQEEECGVSLAAPLILDVWVFGCSAGGERSNRGRRCNTAGSIRESRCSLPCARNSSCTVDAGHQVGGGTTGRSFDDHRYGVEELMSVLVAIRRVVGARTMKLLSQVGPSCQTAIMVMSKPCVWQTTHW